jgi:hypothetical protein
MAITWEHDWERAFERARAERKPLPIDVEREH